MPRPRKHCRCRRYLADRVYKPQGIPMREIETTVLSIDQFEAMRLCDVENLDQEAAGQKMGVSRGTVQRLLYSGRSALIDAMLNNHAILVNLRPTQQAADSPESEATDAGMYSYQRQRRSRRHRL